MDSISHMKRLNNLHLVSNRIIYPSKGSQNQDRKNLKITQQNPQKINGEQFFRFKKNPYLCTPLLGKLCLTVNEKV
ncbi:hypothetical protein ACM44_14645 [Chryseobacterium koreense CCUG 49689]|uniref:Uncharacterized protein n=1 Tax=Chryseobacterium koreense CCUG 49689 TaxID=1304281 RepID=A0A0J7IRB3_9FLAO|nr:hypothetical protein ACM44_14645 [Chryseobacterium koreense CCUG 49689]MBB5333572.1 hypothetical protein [Chryseobacterium koreense]